MGGPLKDVCRALPMRNLFSKRTYRVFVLLELVLILSACSEFFELHALYIQYMQLSAKVISPGPRCDTQDYMKGKCTTM